MNKTAIFGGTFDPVHFGHLACIRHLVEEMDFSDVVLVPTSQNPLKADKLPAGRNDRLQMLQIATRDYADHIQVDDFELNQENPAYSIDTIKRYLQDHDPSDLYLVMGLDTFAEFDQWKDFDKLIEMTNLLVVSRPPHRRPFGVADLPEGLQPHVHTYERGFAMLKTERTIEFVNINSDDISSTDVRKKLKSGKNLSSLIDIEVEKYIVDQKVYPLRVEGEIDFLELTKFVAQILNERAMNCMGYDFTDMEKLYDYTLVASATSTKAAQALSANIKDAIKEEFGLAPYGMEGREDGRWVILDYGAVIVHIFYDFARQEYHLEGLWKEAKQLELPGPEQK